MVITKVTAISVYFSLKIKKSSCVKIKIAASTFDFDLAFKNISFGQFAEERKNLNSHIPKLFLAASMASRDALQTS